MGQSVVSRADLVRCLRVLDDEAMARWGTKLGFEQKPKAVAPVKTSGAQRAHPHFESQSNPMPAPPPQEDDEIPALGSRKVPALSFWRVKSMRLKGDDEVTRDAPAWFKDAHIIADGEKSPDLKQKPPRPQPLVIWSRLWPLLRKVLGEHRRLGRIDLRRAIDRCAKGEPLYPLPEQLRLAWASCAQVWVDRRFELAPFWPDFSQLIKGLQALRGRHGLEIRQLDQGILGPSHPWGQCDREGALEQLPHTAQVVLAVSDLGRYDENPESRRAWTRWGKRLRAAGIQATALVPCPARMWISEPNDPWDVIFWDRGTKLSARRRRLPIAEPTDLGVEHLLRLLSAAVLVEPALLRAVRQLLPGSSADVGSEWQFWWHRVLVRQLQSVNFSPDPDVLETYRNGYKELTHGERAVALIRRHHVNRSPYILLEEYLLGQELLGLGFEDDQLMACIARTVAHGSFEGLQAWFGRLSRRQHAAMWSHLQLASAYVLGFPDAALPEGLRPDDVAWALEQNPKDYTLRVHGQQWTVGQEGSFFLRLRSSNGYLEMEQADAVKAFRLDESHFPEGLAAAGDLTLHTDLASWTLEKTPRPSWAGSMGRDPHGLFVTWRDRKLYWLNPGELSLGPDLPPLIVDQGRWLDEAQYLAWAQVGIECPEGAQQLGLDEVGVYADFTFKNVSWRMRLILPDRFMMGSPEDEPERFDDELHHEVLLSQAYWLAETACTQTLWQAVMGKNPSHFKGPEHPVDTVSWNGVGDFLAKLPKDYAMRLPSEAEWEYACRAGTQTPFSFGTQLDWKQVNFNANHPYHDQAKGEFRKQTLAVKDLPPNPWGLFQMHGNIWEWCADWFAGYDPSMLVDPRGPGTGANRVLRGGGWFGGGRNVRAACRDSGGPGRRNQSVGFRLARGQNSEPLKQKKIERRTVEQPRDEGGETVRSGAGNR